ncbi:DUF305 domain-containing protein [Nostoc punctiforme FACHB-252]|uniref:DUF305 domain-containing protein n=1 Tax=Nostoc punctiforme FACHB-252 TaxID=1357509 RepID=A0ABR8HDP3_NOSPU|nr:DUF305 domain-containing protein [Nostoc punctiforme]MBD2613923.1 DUF305 domain-containing protein [Nostoc punctiforme FACHB-252]
MKTKTLLYGLAGLLSSSALAGLVILNNAQAQVSNSEHNTHHPSTQTTPPPQRGMMTNMDQHFIEMMVPHHTQAMEMADIALSRAQRPEIKKLAAAIKNDQNREIQQMKSWYKAWYGKEVPVTAMTRQEMMAMHQRMCQQMNPGMMKMPMNCNMMGMNVDLAALKNAPDFDKEFIRQMIPHHRMALMMSQMATQKATKPEIRNLAQSIIKTQTAEINQMQQWYQAWYKSNPEES